MENDDTGVKAQGSAGPQGLIDPKSDTGDKGPQGIQGSIGQTDSQGPKGEKAIKAKPVLRNRFVILPRLLLI